MVILVAYSAWVYPFEIAFMNSSPKGGLCIADDIVDIFFAIDIILTFFVAYIDSRTQLLVQDQKKIAVRYLSTWFIMDVASTIPFEGLGYLITGEVKEGVSYSILGILRLWRLRKVKQFFTRLEKDIRFSYFLIRCARLLAVTLFLVHCAGCLYYLLADRYPHQGKTWIGAVISNFREASLWIRYITSIYWSITTMTTVGYGDLHACNLLTVTATGNSSFLEDLLKLGMDPNIGDSKGRTPLHIAASKGYKDCVLVLLRHACNVNIKDIYGNTALWLAITAKHHKIFSILFHFASMSNPHVRGDLLCLAAKRNDLITLKELLKYGLDIDSEDHEGLTSLQVALAEDHVEMVQFLLLNGASIEKVNLNGWKTTKMTQEDIQELIQKREVGYPISILEIPKELKETRPIGEKCHMRTPSTRDGFHPRVSLYRGHPLLRNPCSEAGKLISLPNTMEELKGIIGEKFRVDTNYTIITNEEGAEIDYIEVIRDNDKLFVVTEDELLKVNMSCGYVS